MERVIAQDTSPIRNKGDVERIKARLKYRHVKRDPFERQYLRDLIYNRVPELSWAWNAWQGCISELYCSLDAVFNDPQDLGLVDVCLFLMGPNWATDVDAIHAIGKIAPVIPLLAKVATHSH